MIYHLLITAACFFFIFKAADVFVISSSSIAAHFGISPVFIGLVLVGLGTSAPEFFVSTIASMTEHSPVALGNATGSIVCNTGVALAIIFMLSKKISIDKRFCLINALFLVPSAVLMIFIFKNRISSVAGIVLILILFVYFLANIRLSKPAPKISAEDKVSLLFLKFFLSLLGIVVLSKIIVLSATSLARSIGISEFLIGITVIAVGTSLPEISTAISAARKGRPEIAVGNVIGANALNLYLIIGSSAAIRPMKIPDSVSVFGWPLLMLCELFLFIRLEKIPSKVKAGILFATYCAYIISSFNIL